MPETTPMLARLIEAGNMLKEAEAAEVLGFSRSTLRRLRSVGGGPRFLKLGHGPGAAVRYDPRDIAAWIQEGTCSE